MSVRTYPWYDTSLGLGYYAITGSDTVAFDNVLVYEGLVSAWPNRPANSADPTITG